MNVKIRKLVRSMQVYFPYLQDFRFYVQRSIRKILDRTHEDDFEILSSLPFRNDLFIDIGANRGDAIQSMLMRSPSANIVAFEPNNYLCEKLKQRYRKNENIKIVNSGLGNARSNFDLFVPFYQNYMFDGLASFKEENARDWLTNRLYNFRKEKLELKKINCEVRRLDEFKMKPGFIKMDVQGFEYEVLQGAIDTLTNSKPILLIETPGMKEVDLLRRLHYQPFMFKRGRLVTGTKHTNVFFIPDEMLIDVGKTIPLEIIRYAA